MTLDLRSYKSGEPITVMLPEKTLTFYDARVSIPYNIEGLLTAIPSSVLFHRPSMDITILGKDVEIGEYNEQA
jgi:hypothetical protein